MLAQGDRVGRWRHVGDAVAPFVPVAEATGLRLAREGDGDVDLRVLREALRALQVDGASRRIHPVLPVLPQPGDHTMGVAQQEVGRVYQHPAVSFGSDREPPQNRLGKRILHGASLVGVIAVGAELVVPLDHEDLRAHALEDDEP